jgi:hypothetical protein
MTTTTKALGYALRSLYPAAFASYQGIVFKVTGPEIGTLRGYKPDMNLTIKVRQKLAEESGKALVSKATQKLVSQVADDTDRRIAINELGVTIPNKIELRFDESLDMVFCSDPSCGTLDRLSYHKYPPRDRMPNCRTCKSAPVQQAPVWIPQRITTRGIAVGHAMLGGTQSSSFIRNMGTRQIFCYYSMPGDGCLNPLSTDKKCVHDFVAKLGSLRMQDPQRPIDSLRRYNPHCPKGLPVQPKELERLHRTTTYWYKMDYPRESMTVPLQVSAVESYSIPGDTEIEEINSVLHEVKPLIFNGKLVDLEHSQFSRLRVLEVTYGYRVGNRFTGVSEYYLDGQDNNVPGRLTETQGFVMTLRPELYDAVEKIREEQYREQSLDSVVEVALHSLKHALLVLVPLYTGFEPDKFYGSFDALGSNAGARVSVYDTDEGGSGGFASLMRDRTGFLRMLREIRKRLACPTRDCLTACKQCLFIKNCGNVNRKLNRHLLTELGIFQLE